MRPAVVKMYGTNWCGDCKRAKKFLAEHRIAYDFVDVDQDADALGLVEQTNAAKRSIPPLSMMAIDGLRVRRPGCRPRLAGIARR